MRAHWHTNTRTHACAYIHVQNKLVDRMVWAMAYRCAWDTTSVGATAAPPKRGFFFGRRGPPAAPQQADVHALKLKDATHNLSEPKEAARRFVQSCGWLLARVKYRVWIKDKS